MEIIFSLELDLRVFYSFVSLNRSNNFSLSGKVRVSKKDDRDL